MKRIRDHSSSSLNLARERIAYFLRVLHDVNTANGGGAARVMTLNSAYNLQTGRAYTGSNVVTLCRATREAGEDAALFVSAAQARLLGGHIPAGTPVSATVVALTYVYRHVADGNEEEIEFLPGGRIKILYKVYHYRRIVDADPARLAARLAVVQRKEHTLMLRRAHAVIARQWPRRPLTDPTAEPCRALFERCLRDEPWRTPLRALLRTVDLCYANQITFVLPDHPAAAWCLNMTVRDAAFVQMTDHRRETLVRRELSE